MIWAAISGPYIQKALLPLIAGHLSWSLLISSPSFLHARWVAGWDCASSDARRHEGWRGSHDEELELGSPSLPPRGAMNSFG